MTEQPVEPDAELIAPPREDEVEAKLKKGRRQAIAAGVLMLGGMVLHYAGVLGGWSGEANQWGYTALMFSALFWWYAYDNVKDSQHLMVHEYNDLITEYNTMGVEYNELQDAAQDMADIAEALLDQNGERVPEEDVDDAWQALKSQLEEGKQP